MNEISIYILVDPRKPELVRYVGQTAAPQTRHLQHCAERATTIKSEWLEQLRNEGIMPQMVIVAKVDKDQADEAEKLWIKRFHFGNLTNTVSVKNVIPNGAPAIKPIEHPQPVAAQTAISSLQEAERDLVARTLTEVNWNKRQAAAMLGIGRQTLYNKIKAFGLSEQRAKRTPAVKSYYSQFQDDGQD